MFTGIIEELGTVLESGEGRLLIRAPMVVGDSALGDSIAINGVDLTVAEVEDDTFFANLMPETYRRSALGDLRRGRPREPRTERAAERPAERAHRAGGDRRGGGDHRHRAGRATPSSCRIAAPPELLRYTVVKGPVCIDGVSLTIIAKDEDVAVGLPGAVHAGPHEPRQPRRGREGESRDRHHGALRRAVRGRA